MLQFKASHFLTGEELAREELLALVSRAEELRTSRRFDTQGPLSGKSIALLFEKPSLRTRISFSVGVQELGGAVVELDGGKMKQEEPEDLMRVVQGMVHGLMLRTFEHNTLTRMASVAKIPVINGLSDDHHPCQAIADLQTLQQHFGTLKNLKLAYVGDGNNVLHSLLLMLPYAGVDVHYSCPKGYEPDAKIVKRAQVRARLGGAQIRTFKTPEEAVSGVNAVYTDVWASMGQEKEFKARAKIFKKFQVNKKLFSLASKNAVAMHCLPMLREVEITSEVVEHSRSVLFAQAENRLHAQKALIEGLFNGVSARAKVPKAKIRAVMSKKSTVETRLTKQK